VGGAFFLFSVFLGGGGFGGFGAGGEVFCFVWGSPGFFWGGGGVVWGEKVGVFQFLGVGEGWVFLGGAGVEG